MSPYWYLLIGFIAGGAVGWFFSSQVRVGNSAAAMRSELEKMRKQHEKYREEVDRHFVQTSNLVNNLTQSYKNVHEHLSTGAQSLCSQDLAKMLENSTTPLISDAIPGETLDTVPGAEVPRRRADETVSDTASRMPSESEGDPSADGGATETEQDQNRSDLDART